MRIILNNKKYTGEIGVHDDPQVEHVMVDGAALEVVDKFCYLSDMISVGGGAEESVIARTKSGWKRIRDLLPVKISHVKITNVCTYNSGLSVKKSVGVRLLARYG